LPCSIRRANASWSSKARRNSFFNASLQFAHQFAHGALLCFLQRRDASTVRFAGLVAHSLRNASTFCEWTFGLLGLTVVATRFS
jgi:hypothetical protein